MTSTFQNKKKTKISENRNIYEIIQFILLDKLQQNWLCVFGVSQT